MKPIDNQQNFPSVEIFNAQISESFPRTENEVTQGTKFSALLPYGPCCYRFSATRPAARCHTREKQRKTEIQINPEMRGQTPLRFHPLRVHRALQLHPDASLQLFFSSLTLAKQPSTIGRPVQRQPTGFVHSLIFLPCTLLPHYAGNPELPAYAAYTA